MELDFDHLQDCVNGLRDYVIGGKLDDALKITTYLQREGQLAILHMQKGQYKDFYPKVTALLEILESNNIDSHPKLRHAVAKTARVFAQLAADRLKKPFPEDVKNGLLEKIEPRIKASLVGNQFALRYELTCLQEAVKGIDTGISLFNLSLAAGVIKGGVELATGSGPTTLLNIAKRSFKKIGAVWYTDALRLSWIGQMGKNDEETFAFFCEQVNGYVFDRCKLVNLEKRHVLIGLVDTFAEIAWTSRSAQHQRTAALWIARLADMTQPKTPLKEVRYRAVEQLVAMKKHHINSIRALATLQLQSHQKTETKKLVLKLIKTTAGRENTGFQEGPELTPTRSIIEELLKSPTEIKVEHLHSDMVDGHAAIIAKLEKIRPPDISHTSSIRLLPSHRHFVGRSAELKQLEDYFFEETWEHQQSCRVALLCGLGGMGKTELGLRLANQCRSRFAFVWTIPAGSAEARAGAYYELAVHLGVALEKKSTPDQIRDRLFARLESTSFKKPYLLFYDNVEEELQFPKRNGHLLVTVRNQKFAPTDMEVHKLELLPMQEEEGLTLLKKWTGEEESPAMKKLFHRMGGYPFVLAQAGAYIGSNPLRTIAKYVKKHTVPRKASPKDRYKKTLDQVLSITLQALEEEMPLAFEWLQICAYLSPDNIPLAYLEKQFTDEKDREQVALCLTNRSLMSFANEMFSTHRHIQEALRSMDVERNALGKATALLARLMSDSENLSDPAESKIQLAHWVVHVGLLLDFEGHIPLTMRAELLSMLGALEGRGLGHYSKALRHLNQGLSINKELFGRQHPAVATSLNSIGNVLAALGRYDEALAHHQQALAIRRESCGEEHLDTMESLYSIGLLYYEEMKNYEEAKKWFQQLVTVAKKVLPKEDIQVAIYQYLLEQANNAC